MSRKILSALIAAFLLLSLCSCGGGSKPADDSSSAVSGGNATDSGVSGETEPGSEITTLPGLESNSSMSPDASGGSHGTTTSGKNGSGATKTQTVVTVPTKTSDSAQMVDPGFLNGVDPFKDPVFSEQVTDLKGKTIKLGTFWPNNYKASNSDPIAQANVKAIAAIQKEYKCTIKVVNLDANSYLTDVATATAGGKIVADIYAIQGDMNSLYKNGYFADLSKVKSVGLKTNGWSQAAIANATYKNTCYGVGLEKDVGYSVVYFKKALASQYKIGNLYDLVDKGQWTWSKFREASEAVYKQSSGKVYGCNATFTPYIFNLVFSNGTSPIVLANGIPVFNGLDSKLLEALNWLQDYCKAGLYNKKGSSGYVTAINSFMGGNSLFYIAGNGSPDINDLSALMKDDYGILPFPKGDGQKDYTCILLNNRYYGLASNNAQVEDAGKILVALGNRTFTKAADWEKRHAGYVRDDESLGMLRKIRSYKSIFRLSTSSFENNAAAACVDQKMTPKQAMEAILNTAQAEINERFGI